MQTMDVNVLREFPDPTPSEDSLHFWERAKAGHLEIQKCTPCGRGVFPPRPSLCPYCHGELAWTETSRASTVYSWVGVDRAMYPWLRDAVPFTIVIAALRDFPDVRIPCFFAGGRERLELGLPGTIRFHEIGRTYPLLGYEVTGEAEK